MGDTTVPPPKEPAVATAVGIVVINVTRPAPRPASSARLGALANTRCCTCLFVVVLDAAMLPLSSLNRFSTEPVQCSYHPRRLRDTPFLGAEFPRLLLVLGAIRAWLLTGSPAEYQFPD
jgi:hypothetical protein